MGRVGPLAVAFVLCPLAAAGQDPPTVPSRVRIEAAPCEVGPFDNRAWIPLVRNELETDGVGAVDVAPPPTGDDPALAVIRVEPARCTEDATEAAVTLDDLLTHKTVRRVVALDDIPAAGRPRALALAIAELLRASWAELAMEGSHTATPVPPAIRRAVLLRVRPVASPARPPAAVVTPPAPRWWVSATVDVRTFPGQSGALLGLRATSTWSPFQRVPLRLRADLGWAQGTALASRGEIEMNVVTAALGVLLGGGNERVDLSVGPRVEVGWAWIEGIPFGAATAGRSGSDVVLFGLLTATLRVALTARWSAAVDVSAGQTLRYVTVSADGERVAGLRGPMLSVGIGLGASLP